MDVCETKNMDQFNEVHVFEPMKVHTFEPNIWQIRLFSLMLIYAKPRIIRLLLKCKLNFDDTNFPCCLAKLSMNTPQGIQTDSCFSIHSTYLRLCHLPDEPDERHPMNQTILINHGVLDIVFGLLSQEVDVELLASFILSGLCFKKMDVRRRHKSLLCSEDDLF